MRASRVVPPLLAALILAVGVWSLFLAGQDWFVRPARTAAAVKGTSITGGLVDKISWGIIVAAGICVLAEPVFRRVISIGMTAASAAAFMVCFQTRPKVESDDLTLGAARRTMEIPSAFEPTWWRVAYLGATLLIMCLATIMAVKPGQGGGKTAQLEDPDKWVRIPHL